MCMKFKYVYKPTCNQKGESMKKFLQGLLIAGLCITGVHAIDVMKAPTGDLFAPPPMMGDTGMETDPLEFMTRTLKDQGIEGAEEVARLSLELQDDQQKDTASIIRRMMGQQARHVARINSEIARLDRQIGLKLQRHADAEGPQGDIMAENERLEQEKKTRMTEREYFRSLYDKLSNDFSRVMKGLEPLTLQGKNAQERGWGYAIGRLMKQKLKDIGGAMGEWISEHPKTAVGIGAVGALGIGAAGEAYFRGDESYARRGVARTRKFVEPVTKPVGTFAEKWSKKLVVTPFRTTREWIEKQARKRVDQLKRVKNRLLYRSVDSVNKAIDKFKREKRKLKEQITKLGEEYTKLFDEFESEYGSDEGEIVGRAKDGALTVLSNKELNKATKQYNDVNKKTIEMLRLRRKSNAVGSDIEDLEERRKELQPK